jgi:hypothetical protein
MNSRRFLYCVFGVALAVAFLFMLLTVLHPRVAEAQSNVSNLPAQVAQGPGQPLVVFPDPPQANEPTEIRVFVHNGTPSEVTRYVQFSWSLFGIGQERHPIAERIPFVIPPMADGTAFVVWIPPDIGPYCFYADIFEGPEVPVPIQVFQHNVTFQGHPDPTIPTFNEVVPVPVRNPFPGPATFVLTLTVPDSATTWEALIEPHQVVIPGGGIILANAVFTYTGSGELPPDGTQIFRVDAAADGQPVGSVDIVFGPPVRLHFGPEPIFAESEISVNPYPVPPGEPAEICVEVRNVTHQPREAWVFFQAAPFGIGMHYEPVAPPVHIVIPDLGMRRPCVQWVAPDGGQFAFEVHVETPGFPMMVASQRVVDVNELLIPGTSSKLLFPVRNPFPQPVTITLGMVPAPLNLGLELSQDVLSNMRSDETRIVTLTVTVPPDSVMPPDESPVVDVEAFAGTIPIGGFRKIYRPPVPIHQPSDPIYAEREITIDPYPPREREPTEICVDIRNPTPNPMIITVNFNVAEFGIGMPFHAIARPIPVAMPANSIKKVCVTWVPPFGGRFGAEVGLQVAGHERVFSQRVIDVGEILFPNQPSLFEFVVRNPFTFPITVTMGAIRYLPQWEVAFDPPFFELSPGQPIPVVMTINPVQGPGDPEPHEGEPVIDVEAYWLGNDANGLLGGFRKLFFPPVPIHRPEDPPFAEREINIFPYPPRAGEPTHLEFVARNPTTDTQPITVTFEWGNLGIGLPFTPIDGPHTIVLPPAQVGVVGITWVPPFGGEFCVRVRVEAPFFTEPFFSARNISIVRLPEPYGLPEVFPFVVGDNGITDRPLTITLGLKGFLPNWQLALDTNRIVLEPGQLFATGVLTITPPANPGDLPVDGGPIADVSAYVDGYLIGGIRKVWRPPVPLGQLGEPSYAESEIAISPDPPIVGQPSTFSAQVRNNSDYEQTIALEFGWADFGFGIPFTTTTVVPTQTMITLSPHMSTTVSAQWTPPYSGHFCVQIYLTNIETQEKLHSQRNVDPIVVPEHYCEPFTREFLLQNATPLVVTVTIGTSAINLPPGWEYSVDPEEAVLGPYESITVTVVITPPCNLMAKGFLAQEAGLDVNNPAKIRVEGYDQNGELVGGVELRLAPQQQIYLPQIWRMAGAGSGLMRPAGLPLSGKLSYLPAAFFLLGWIGVVLRIYRSG